MASKNGILTQIIQELRRAQVTPWNPPPPGRYKTLHLPPTLPMPDGRQLHATDELLVAVRQYAELIWQNDPALKPRFRIGEFVGLARDAFGEALPKLDLAETDDALAISLKDDVAASLDSRIERHDRPLDLTLGCHLFEGDAVYPIEIGPVIFETREQWRLRSLKEGRVSKITGRRLASHWGGKRLEKRKPSFDSQAETAVLDAVGRCPVICTVRTEGLSSKYVNEKGLLAARLAMTALALMWGHPSKGLEWMNLLYDRRMAHRHTVLFSTGTNVGSSSELSQMPCGKNVDAELADEIKKYASLFRQVGEALASYVQPGRGTNRPRMMNALFLSLWWFHEACREPLDQIATTKFAASLDALVVGQSANAIIKFIEARLRIGREDILITNGLTTTTVIKRIYEAGRSRLIHGSSDDFSHDWSQTRGMVESVGRLCLVMACDWMAENPSIDELTRMSER